jgi:hypothetical protein
MRLSETRNYGFNQIVKQYASFPWYLPLPAHLEHGWTPIEEALKSDLGSKKPLMLVFSKRRAEAWKKQSSIPVAVMGSPFIHFKNMHHITKQKDAKGTIVFPSHSTYSVTSQFSVEQYCRELKNLSSEFQPITICLFWLDFIDKKANIYRKFGFNVVSAGYKFSIGLDFVENFYKILSSHKYASANEVGSYTFYAIDLGLPFFLTGKAPLINNIGNDVNLAKSVKTIDFKYGEIASGLFETGPITKISLAQKEFADREMGLQDCLSRTALRDLLIRTNKSYRSFHRTLKYLIESALLRFIFNGPWGKIVIALRRRTVRK